MSLEDDLKARTLALISQQMANWVVEIQRPIQANTRATSCARSTSSARRSPATTRRSTSRRSARRCAEVVAQQPPAAAAAPTTRRLKASLAAIEKGANLSEVLTYLVNEVAQARRPRGDVHRQGQRRDRLVRPRLRPPRRGEAVNVPLTADTRLPHRPQLAPRDCAATSASRRARPRPWPGSAATRRASWRCPSSCATRSPPILYCDTRAGRGAAGRPPTSIEILVAFAGKVIDVLSAAPQARGRHHDAGTTSPGSRRRPVRAAGDAGAATPAPAPPGPRRPRRRPARHRARSGAQRAALAAAATLGPTACRRSRVPRPRRAPGRHASAPRPAVAPRRPAPSSPEEQKAHDDAKRFARLVVSEIKLYNEAKVDRGPRRQGHLRAAQGRHRARPPDVRRPRRRRRARHDELLPRRARAHPGRGRRERPRPDVGRARRLARELVVLLACRPRRAPPRPRRAPGAGGLSRPSPGDAAGGRRCATPLARRRRRRAADGARRAVARQHPGSAASGPRPARGGPAACVDADRDAEAIALSHAPRRRSRRSLRDHALLGPRPRAGGARPARRRRALLPRRRRTEPGERRRLRRPAPGRRRLLRAGQPERRPSPRSSGRSRRARATRPRAPARARRGAARARRPRGRGRGLRPPRPRVPRLRGRRATARARLAALADAAARRRTAAERRARDLLAARHGAPRRGPHRRGGRARCARVPLASLPAGDEADLARVRLGRALLARGPRRARRASLLAEGRAPTRRHGRRGRLPPRARAGARSAHGRSAYEAVADALPRARRGARRRSSRSPTTTRRTRSTTPRCRAGAGCSPSTRDGRYVERAAWRVGLGRLPRRPLRATPPTRSRAHRAAAPAERLDRRASSTGPAGRALALGQNDRARAALRGDGPALQVRLPRRCAPARRSPASAPRPAARPRGLAARGPGAGADMPEPRAHAACASCC